MQVREDLVTLPKRRGNDSVLSRLHYTSDAYPFLGRVMELLHLAEFLEAPVGNGRDAFRWGLITGEGGVGKSRLAYELCRDPARASAKRPWRAGFLAPHDLEAFSASVTAGSDISAPLLVVVDNAMQRPAQLRTLLQRLARYAPRFSHPVRLLLIDTPETAPWHEDVLVDPPSEEADPRRTCWPEPIAPDAREIPAFRLPSVSSVNIDRLLQEGEGRPFLIPREDMEPLVVNSRDLVDIPWGDNLLTPLIVLLYIEYVRPQPEKANPAVYEKDIWFFDSVLELERRDWWRPAAPDDAALAACENLLALATFVGGLHVDQWRDFPEDLLEGGALPGLDDLPRLRPLLERMGLSEEGFLPPMEPKYLAEHFVLEKFMDVCDLGMDVFRSYRDLAWRLGSADSAAAATFWTCMIKDFSYRLIRFVRREYFAPTRAAGQQAVLAFLRAVREVTDVLRKARSDYSFREDREKPTFGERAHMVLLEILQSLSRDLGDTHTETSVLAGLASGKALDGRLSTKGRARARLGTQEGSWSAVVSADSILARLEALHAAHPDDVEIARHLAKYLSRLV